MRLLDSVWENEISENCSSASYDIFLKYIKFGGQDLVVDVSAIFSKECFLDWTSTRPSKKLMHAAKSFQRVLYAHIRGADKRRPFAPNVEAELLRVLRDDRNPWENLFKDTSLGKRGFKSLGFHENLKYVTEAGKQGFSKEDSVLSLTKSPSFSECPSNNEIKKFKKMIEKSNEFNFSGWNNSRISTPIDKNTSTRSSSLEADHNLGSSAETCNFLENLGQLADFSFNSNRPRNPSVTTDSSLPVKNMVSRSYEIFMKHVSYNPGSSNADVCGIFSQQCFQEWLSTRISHKVKFPAESYQRVLYAHIRGADKRRPFPEPIEKELLKVLRDKSNNPWRILFQTEKREIGKRGFTSAGYHERMKLSRHGDRPELKSRQAESLSLQLASPCKRSMTQIGAKLAADKFSGNDYFPTFRAATKNLTPWVAIANVFDRYVSVDARNGSSAKLEERGLKVWTPGVFYFLNELVDPDDSRFSWMFIFPSIEEQFFRTDRPVSQLRISLTNTITGQDENANALFGGPLIGCHLFEIYGSMVSLCYSVIGHIPQLYGKGKVWRRDVLKRTDGTRMVCLIYMVNTGTEFIQTLQDQSELFAEVLKKVSFL